MGHVCCGIATVRRICGREEIVGIEVLFWVHWPIAGLRQSVSPARANQLITPGDPGPSSEAQLQSWHRSYFQQPENDDLVRMTTNA